MQSIHCRGHKTRKLTIVLCLPVFPQENSKYVETSSPNLVHDRDDVETFRCGSDFGSKGQRSVTQGYKTDGRGLRCLSVCQYLYFAHRFIFILFVCVLCLLFLLVSASVMGICHF